MTEKQEKMDVQVQIDALEKAINERDAQIHEYTDHLKRLQADFDNYMKRSEGERKTIAEAGTAQLIAHLLNTLDDFERSVESAKNGCSQEQFIEGVHMIFTQFQKVLQEQGLTPIKTVGEKLDPYKHEAILQVESDEPEGTILEELQKGYMVGDQVVRFAKVKVAKKKAEEKE